jgi:hypothetical protein
MKQRTATTACIRPLSQRGCLTLFHPKTSHPIQITHTHTHTYNHKPQPSTPSLDQPGPFHFRRTDTQTDHKPQTIRSTHSLDQPGPFQLARHVAQARHACAHSRDNTQRTHTDTQTDSPQIVYKLCIYIYE